MILRHIYDSVIFPLINPIELQLSYLTFIAKSITQEIYEKRRKDIWKFKKMEIR